MAAGSQAWSGLSRRRVPRFRVEAPLDVTVLRSGIPDTVPGRSVNLCERGIAAVLAGELAPDEAVGIEVRLPLLEDPLRARATVRYQNRLRYGFEFLGMSAEQRAAIRDWAKEAKVVMEVSASPAPAIDKKSADPAYPMEGSRQAFGDRAGGSPKRKRRWWGWILLLVVAAVLAGWFWWKWNQEWEELESGLKSQELVSEKVQAQVPAEVMEKLLIHRVEPVYPAQAREGKLQGVIALQIVVGRDGSVMSMHALNGPDVLARAAMDALRWWKFEPYRVNGEPAVVETIVAVEFKG